MLISEKINRTLFLKLNRPDKRNALNNELVGAIKKAMHEAKSDMDLKCIVLQGEGDVFSAGADLQSLQNLQNQSYEQNLADSTHLAELFELISTHPLPIISAIHGDAIAGGCGLATVCDISIASETARFGYTEVRIGFVPAIVSYFLSKKVGDTRARQILLSGRLFTAHEAFQWGLITEMVPINELNDRVSYWIDTFENKVSKQSVSMTKQLITESHHQPMSTFLHYAAQLNATARASEDCKKGVSAFLNKEKLTW